MRSPPGLASLQARITLWCTASVACALVGFAVVVYLSLGRVLWGELDDRLHHEIETGEGLLQPYWTPAGPRTPDGGSPLDDDDERWLQVWSLEGRLLFETGAVRAVTLDGLAVPRSDAAMSTRGHGGVPYRVRSERGHIASHPVMVRVALREDRVRRERALLMLVMGLALPLCAGAAAYGGFHLVRRTLAPIDRLVSAASRITADRMSVRLPVETPGDEVGAIAHAFNATLARLEGSFDQMVRFTGNASHELRTPLTALQTTGQLALHGATTDEAWRTAVGSMLEEAALLSRLVDMLLLLARSDAGQITLDRRPTSIGDLVREVAGACHVLAEEKAITLEVTGSDISACLDPTVLRIALANVVHNAIRHSPAGGTIRISIAESSLGAVVEVLDSGAGIPADRLELIFERFYRGGGTSAAGEGTGLGLAMARWAVEIHGGTVTASNAPSRGALFTLKIPTGLPQSERFDS